MCVKLPPGDLNPDPCPTHPTSTYTCGVTTAPRVCSGTICNVDIGEKDCQSCIVNATNEIRSLFPNSNGAIKWSNNCTLKYHNVDFFGHIDHETWFFTKDLQNLTNYQSIRQKKSEWLTQLIGQASINPPMVLFKNWILVRITNSTGQFNALETFQAWTVWSASMIQ